MDRLYPLAKAGVHDGAVIYRVGGTVSYPGSALDSLNRRHGNTPIEQMDSIIAGGRRYLDRKFPGLDRILRVSVPTEWRHRT